MNYETLTKKINYQFKNLALLEAALTHRSVAGVNNERLEFLGDSILNCIIASTLYQRHLKAKEGELSRLRASLVKGDTLAELAQEFALSPYLRLGPGEQRSGGAQRESILADAIEALIGAIYLDSNFETCEQLVLSWFEKRLVNLTLANNLKDPKTQLQEILQAHRYGLPVYTVVATTGEAHDQMFYIECYLAELNLRAEGQGKSRRRAEQEAAEKILMQMKK